MIAAVIATLALGGINLACAQDAPATGGVDASLQDTGAGAGDRLQGAVKNLKYLHGAGGPTMYFIDLALIIGVGFVLERIVRMRRRRILPGGVLSRATSALDSKDFGAVREAVGHSRSTLGKVLLYLIETEDVGWEEREATVNEIASRDIDVHRMMCFPLAAIAGLSPLMGLLGTVSGIRECFRDVALAGEMGNPAMLAGGIEKALITTIYGLVVAIITLFCYNFFKFRMNLMANELEEVLSTVMGRHFKKRAAGNEA
jgi:biopolymer transport protein ExbB